MTHMLLRATVTLLLVALLVNASVRVPVKRLRNSDDEVRNA